MKREWRFGLGVASQGGWPNEAAYVQKNRRVSPTVHFLIQRRFGLLFTVKSHHQCARPKKAHGGWLGDGSSLDLDIVSGAFKAAGSARS